MKASAHPHQAKRLDALRRMGVLDTERERAFDEIVELASQICGAPISVVNLIDEDRQWFKAEVGLGVRETPLETSICSHVILEDEFVEIEDTLLDQRMIDNPLCNGENGLRFYAGAQLTTSDGLHLGTLCVLDTQPRQLTDLQRTAIRVLANQVMKQLELRQALKMQEVLRQEIDHRVKNSLMAISSIVRLQRNRLDNDDMRSVLDNIYQRIQSVAFVHQELHQISKSSKVDLHSLMANIGRMLHESTPETIMIETSFDPVSVTADQASAIAIIANEFVSNSVKHAFPDASNGTIRLTGKRIGADQVRVQFDDNGIGTDIKADMVTGTGLGLRIITALANQLGAEIDHESAPNGVRLGFTFTPNETVEAAH